MAEYMNAFELEITVEGFIDSICKKSSQIFATLRKLFDQCIKFLIGLINKLRKHKATNQNQQQSQQQNQQSAAQKYTTTRAPSNNQDPTPNSQAGGGAEVMQHSTLTPVYKEDTYDCSKELYDILAELKFCMDMIVKRPVPNHKTNKSYKERWAQDDQLIMERIERCGNIVEKLESIDNKTINLDAAEDIKTKFEELAELYNKYGKIYDSFAKKHIEAREYMFSTHIAFTAISEVAGRAAKINLTLMVPKDD